MTAQRLRLAVALAAAAAVVCLLLFAPWEVHLKGDTRSCGRAPVFGRGPNWPPGGTYVWTMYPATSVGHNVWIENGVPCGRIATSELAVEVGAVLAVAGLLLAVIPKPR